MILDYFVVSVALLGAVMNARNMQGAFLLWTFTNAYLTIKNFTTGDYPQGLLFASYLLISLYGLLTYDKHQK